MTDAFDDVADPLRRQPFQLAVGEGPSKHVDQVLGLAAAELTEPCAQAARQDCTLHRLVISLVQRFAHWAVSTVEPR